MSSAGGRQPAAGAAPPADVPALVQQLRGHLARSASLLLALEKRLPREDAAAKTAPIEDRVTELERRLSGIEADREELAARLVEAENQSGRLMNLYVATYQLHATLDPREVQSTIAEIAVNLLGAERFVLLLREGDSAECEVAMAEGIDESAGPLYAGGRYFGGDPVVDAALAEGVMGMGDASDDSRPLAVVPLTVQGNTVGALVLLKLFDHKSRLRPDDRDILDLLAAHAASAILAARVYAQTDRKLRTLEGLLELVRGR